MPNCSRSFSVFHIRSRRCSTGFLLHVFSSTTTTTSADLGTLNPSTSSDILIVSPSKYTVPCGPEQSTINIQSIHQSNTLDMSIHKRKPEIVWFFFKWSSGASFIFNLHLIHTSKSPSLTCTNHNIIIAFEEIFHFLFSLVEISVLRVMALSYICTSTYYRFRVASS